MPAYKACLLDVFNTVISVDFSQVNRSLAEQAGIELELFESAWSASAHAVMIGRATVESTLDQILGTSGGNAENLADYLGKVRGIAVLHDDSIPFLTALRRKHVRTAFVSNCGEDGRTILQSFGLVELVDEVVLSCEIGARKPDPAIFATALTRLDVAAADAFFVDDQQRYCDAAAAVGINAARIDRTGAAGGSESLSDFLRHF